jgi:hypothetical protein
LRRLFSYLISMWKFCERSAAKVVVGDEPRRVFKEKYSGVDFFILRSLKLKAPGPKAFGPDKWELPLEL